MPPLKLIWHDGHFKVPRPPMLEPGRRSAPAATVIYGDKETLMHDSHGATSVRMIAETRMRDFKRPPKELARVKGTHEQDWIRACKDGKPACSPFEYGGSLTELLLVGLIATRFPGEKLQWNGPEMKFTNHDQADELVHPEYRRNWSL